MTRHVVVLDAIGDATAQKMAALLPPGWTFSHGSERSEAHLRAIVAQADYAISGQIGVSAAVLGAAKRLKLLHKWGVGTDNLDLAAARALGIPVARTTGSNAVPVAEFTLGLIFATLRHLAWAHGELQRGHWRGGSLPGPSFQLSGKTVGIVGFGAIGQTLARLLRGFGCVLLYHQPRQLDPAVTDALDVAYVSFDDLLARSDVICLHCPLTEQTRGLIDAAALSQMKQTAVLINVARGGVVVEADLAYALRSRSIHAAATDVFAEEPPPPGHPLLQLDNCIVTPHIAAGCADTFAPTVQQMYDNFQRVERGEPVTARDRVA